MKIDQVLIHYLLKFKELPLQGIGVFKLEGAVSEPAEKEKPLIIPSDAISFEYNPRTKEDENLVSYISEMTGKIKPLASADLDSYLTLGRQFLNIGKPLIIPNIGTVEKNSAGEFTFKGGNYAMERIAPPAEKKELEEMEPEKEESFSDFPLRQKSRGKAVPYVILLIILGLIVWAVWKFAFEHKPENTVTHTEIQPVNEDSLNKIRNSDSTVHLQNQPADSLSTKDTLGFKVVVGIYRNINAAQRRLNDLELSNRNVILYTTDSVHFKIAEPFNLPRSDTSKILDSLRPYYGKDRKYYIE